MLRTRQAVEKLTNRTSRFELVMSEETEYNYSMSSIRLLRVGWLPEWQMSSQLRYMQPL